jgi:hypothetical protein
MQTMGLAEQTLWYSVCGKTISLVLPTSLHTALTISDVVVYHLISRTWLALM